MCNEYRLQKIDGVWKWVHRGTGGGGVTIIKDGDEDFFEVFPDRFGPVIAKDREGEPELRTMRWGFPGVQASGGKPITNVRNTQNAAGKPLQYWSYWMEPRWRALIPFDEFAEWSDSKPKKKHFFSVTDNEPAAFAGIWRPWTGVRGPKSAPVEGEHHLFALLTWSPNEIVAPIHKQAMPVILSGEEEQRAWLEMPLEEALARQRQVFPAARMRVRAAD